MARSCKPLPALYTVYVLRSSVRHASLYIGSTPNPPRRLKQHNGDTRGGASRTSRQSLRPWEMIALVSGFPSMVAALKFEWALTNPHLSLHIPTESRLAISTQTKKNGMPKRPPYSLKSVMSNLHLLTGVPSFARWPLNLHFFVREAHKAWEAWTKSSSTPVRAGLDIITDFDAPAEANEGEPQTARGIHALPLDYAPMKAYVEKVSDAVAFEQEGQCVHCQEELQPGKGLYAMCPSHGCVAMGHLNCWGRHALPAGSDENVIPDRCSCPSCGGDVRWGDMMKELSLRLRGEKEVAKLLKKKRQKTKKADRRSSDS